MRKKAKSRALEAIEAAERGKLPLSKEERAIESSNLKPVGRQTVAFKRAQALIDDVKSQVITARLNGKDLLMLKEQAEAKGLGYQTLLGSIVHQYVTGQLVDIQTARALLKKLG